jgi:predicted DNA-binding transcriptional regulator AlpA
VNAYYLTSREVRARYGGVSDMTLWRWLRDPALNFPKPLVINGRRLWEQAQLKEWEQGRVRV